VSTSAAFTAPLTSVTGDTSASLASPLDSLASYFWRVRATDTRGGVTTSNVGFFRIDAVNPTIDIHLVRSSIIQRYVDMYSSTSEPTLNNTGTFVLKSSTGATLDSIPAVFTSVAGSTTLRRAPYRLSATGTLNLSVNAPDSATNVGTASRTYNVLSILKGKSWQWTSDDGTVDVSGSSKVFKDDGFVLMSLLKTGESERLAKTSESNGRWTDLKTRIEFMGTTPIRENQRVTIRVQLNGTVIERLQNSIADFDERKIGLYQKQDDEWRYLGGEGADGSIHGFVHEFGEVAAFYNPDHVFLPKSVELSQNYPNPFNPSTTIRFGLPEEGRIRLTVYNMLGQRVADLIDGYAFAGYHTITWQGLNTAGHRAASGVYIYRLETPKGVAARKMLLIK
jgi:hypothetical protein